MSRLLIVDDDHAICWCLSRLAARMGHQTQTASSAEQALQFVSRTRPDLVLLDLCLPGMNGNQALGLLRLQVPQCPIILMSAYFERGATLREQPHDNVGQLAKPFTLDQARQAITRGLAWGSARAKATSRS
ncbi:response regulator [Aeoliella mucimassa]|uniref:Sporulation initiation phosphotransferase F n=1 Tax=Aeoliella mucimassa TaxID=2527972 RepID=A0A518AQC0_9BACT|nr:response regulator [Aeoliella mucimassa]QDU56920.1 Sporulation initiation phosphotransferase F [Aeoliella mucimassa]